LERNRVEIELIWERIKAGNIKLKKEYERLKTERINRNTENNMKNGK